jgi:hypothetical protein
VSLGVYFSTALKDHTVVPSSAGSNLTKRVKAVQYDHSKLQDVHAH